MRRHFLTLGTRQVHLRTTGQGPVVVLLHDVPGSAASMMAGLAPPLSQDKCLMAFDLPGHGQSDSLPASATLDDHAREVVSWLDALGLGRVDLCGQGVGAAIALAVAANHEDRVAGVVLDELSMLDDQARSERARRVEPLASPRLDGAHLVEAFHRMRDHWLFRPWYDQDQVSMPVDMPDAATLHDIVMSGLSGRDAFDVLERLPLQVDIRRLLGRVRTPAVVFVSEGSAPHVGSDVHIEAITSHQGHRETVAQRVCDHLQDSEADAAFDVPVVTSTSGHIRRSYLDTPWGQIHLRSAGDPEGARPPLVMLHSAPGSAEPLEDAMLALAEDRLVLAPDFLGNGDSDKPAPDQPVDIAFLARVLDAALDGRSESSFDLWGSHTGGLIAMEMTLARTERYGAMILDAIPLLSGDETADILENYLPELVPDAHGTHLLSAWHKRRDMFLYWPWYNRRGEAVRGMPLPDVETFHDWTMGLLRSGTTYHRSYRAAFEYPTVERLPLVRTRSLLCSGPTDMLAGGLEDARQIAPDCLEVRPAAATVWYPRQPGQAWHETIAMYREFLDASTA